MIGTPMTFAEAFYLPLVVDLGTAARALGICSSTAYRLIHSATFRAMSSRSAPTTASPRHSCSRPSALNRSRSTKRTWREASSTLPRRWRRTNSRGRFDLPPLRKELERPIKGGPSSVTAKRHTRWCVQLL